MSELNTDQVSIYQFVRTLDDQTIVTYDANPNAPIHAPNDGWSSQGVQLQLWKEPAPGRVGVRIQYDETDLTTRLLKIEGDDTSTAVGYATERHHQGTGVASFAFPQLLECPRKFMVPAEQSSAGAQEIWVNDAEELRHIGLSAAELAAAQEEACDYMCPQMGRARLLYRGSGDLNRSENYVMVSNDPVCGSTGELNFYRGADTVIRFDLPQPALLFDEEQPVCISGDGDPGDISSVYWIEKDPCRKRVWVRFNFAVLDSDESFSYFLNIDDADGSLQIDPKITNRANQIPPQETPTPPA